MRKIEHRAYLCSLLSLALLLGLGLFLLRYILVGSDWASAGFNRHIYNTKGQLAVGSVLDQDGDVLTSVNDDGNRTYYENADVRKAVLHAVGDLQGNIGTGALHAFANQLTGYSPIKGAYGLRKNNGGEVYLTLDARYNYEAYKALNNRSGTVAVYNYKTGEILCMVSSPSYDPLHIPSDLESNTRYQGAYINRFLSSTFTPGSVFKTVTLAAALETLPDLESRTWTCKGRESVEGEIISCSGTHGTQDIRDILANSCNIAFAQLAVELGGGTMRRFTERSGLSGNYVIDGLKTAVGYFDFETADLGQLAWAGVGQGNDMVNPCALLIYMGAIANGGRAAMPYLLLKSVSPMGIPSLPHIGQKTPELISPRTAEKLADMMAYNVSAAYGRERFPHMDICAKSGTAEVGGGKSPHAWFTGFLRNPDKPYAFVALVENGGGGSTVAGNVIGKVLNFMVNGS